MSRCCSTCASAVAQVLAEQGKTEWAAQEFEYLRTRNRRTPRRDRWRRTSGIHKVRDPRALAAVREMWTVRDEIARRRDIAPGRILPDSSIIAAALADPKTVDDLTALPVFGGPRQRRSARNLAGGAGAGPRQPRAAVGSRAPERSAAGVALASPQAGGRRAAAGGARRSADCRSGRCADREPGVAGSGAPAVLGLGTDRRRSRAAASTRSCATAARARGSASSSVPALAAALT